MKKFLLSLLIAWLSFIGFSNAWSYTYSWSSSFSSLNSYSFFGWVPFYYENYYWASSSDMVNISCTFSNVNWFTSQNFIFWVINISSSKSISTSFINSFNNCVVSEWAVCSYNNINQWYKMLWLVFWPTTNITDSFSFDWSCVIDWNNIKWESTCPTCPECEVCTPQYTSSECQSEYNLIPISDIDSEYCTINDLCEFTWSYSNIYINDIWFPSKPFIYLSIPDTINWDYTWNSWSMSVDVWDYNVDTDYIDWLVAMNTYQPTSEDFTNVFVGGLTLIFPYIFIALLILFIRKLVKRIFK